MKPGDQIVCVNDAFPAGIEKLYTVLPKKGVTYIVRDMLLGVNLQGKGEVCILLEGVVNPKANSRGHERGFAQWRFIPLAEYRAEEWTDEALEREAQEVFQ